MFSLLQGLIHNFAATCTPGSGGSIFGFPTWYKYLGGELVAGRCTPTVVFPDDIGRILLAIVEILLRLSALIAVGFVIYGGYRFILSQGEPEHANAARSTIINALIGLVITIMATVIITFAFNSLAKY